MNKIVRHKSRDGGFYYQAGSHKISDNSVIELWALMCGEDEILKFLNKCEKDYGFTVAELKERFKNGGV